MSQLRTPSNNLNGADSGGGSGGGGNRLRVLAAARPPRLPREKEPFRKKREKSTIILGTTMSLQFMARHD